MKTILIFTALFICLQTSAATDKPTDPKATPETIKLYQNLLKLQTKGIMFGHQDAMAYGHSWYAEEGRSDVKDVCGDHPAVCGWELGHLELGGEFSLDSVKFSNIQNGIKKVYESGGINTISWHLRNPLTGGTAWDLSSKETVKSILPGGSKHEFFKQYLDKLAAFMLALKTDHGTYIPVLFRPFHEHTGSWFWWGKNLCTVDEYKALWRFTVSYLQNEKNIHHLLYSYSTDRFNTEQEYLERYPGDDVIDLLAFDLYDRGPDYPEVLKSCAGMVSSVAAAKGKIGAVSEAGGPLDKNTSWWTKTMFPAIKNYNLSYVLVWRNPWNAGSHSAFGPYRESPDSADFLKFYNDPKTLFLNDIKKFQK